MRCLVEIDHGGRIDIDERFLNGENINDEPIGSDFEFHDTFLDQCGSGGMINRRSTFRPDLRQAAGPGRLI